MATAQTRLSPKRRVLFTIVAIALPFLLLVMIESVLRLADYGEYPALFEPIEGYDSYLRPSERIAARYFTSIEAIPGIPFDSFHKERDPEGLRIIVQGGSTAAGFPFYFGGSFPDML